MIIRNIIFIPIFLLMLPILIDRLHYKSGIFTNAADITFDTSYVKQAVAILSSKFNHTVSNELGTLAAIDMLEKIKPGVFFLSNDDLLRTISDKLSYKLQAAVGLLENMKNFIMNNSNIPSFTHPCQFNSLRSTRLKNIDGNFVITTGSAPKYVNIDTNGKLIYKWYGRFEDLKIQRQYFLSTMDLAVDKDCSLLSQISSRKMFYRIYQPKPLNVLFIFSERFSSENEFQRSIIIVRELLNTLEVYDQVALLKLPERQFVKLTKCNGGRNAFFSNATIDNSEIIMNHLVQGRINSSHLWIGFTVEDTIKKNILKGQNVEIVLITSSVSDVQNIYNDVGTLSNCSFNVILSFESDPKNLTMFNFLHIQNKEVMFFEKNVLQPVYTAEQVISLFYLSLQKKPINQTPKVMLPRWEPSSRDFVVPLLLLCGDQGVLGVDLFLSDLAEDIMYLKRTRLFRKAFILDLSGKVIMHSDFPRLELVSEKLRFVDISHIEKYQFIAQFRNDILLLSSGNITVLERNISVRFSWKRVEDLYVVCVVSECYNCHSHTFPNTTKTVARGFGDILYHRIDLFPPDEGHMCRYFKQVATTERGTVYLSPSSFHSPFSYLLDLKDSKDSSVKVMQSFLAYLKDTTGLLSNPGLKPGIRSDVAVLNPLLNYFKEQHSQSANLKYIVRRYAATESGVVVTFPGSILDFDYEPVRKAWFMRSSENPQKIIFTPPYLDVGGSGYIVTLSYSLKPSGRSPTVVLAMDVTMGFMYKLLVDTLPVCSQPTLRCFLMDDRGYLVSHPGLLDPSNNGPVEQQHITHKESLIANDILNHKGFVKKQLCNSYADGTVQRYYEFNTSIPNVLSNVLSGERCVHYEIAAITGTNIFVGIVNSSCDAGAFCPCSMVDRVCLNCNRMEQNECECPCECPMPSEEMQCENASIVTPNVPLCKLSPEKVNIKNNYYFTLAMRLKSCFNFKCEMYATQESCLGVLGCEWCQLDTDGETFLSIPFCTAQSSCFNGVLGAITPYGEGSFRHVASENILASYSAVGPVAGCIIAVCLIIAIAIYCYRENSVNINDVYPNAIGDNCQDFDVHMNNLSPDNDINGECSGHQDKLLPIDPSAPVSPYKILTGYRRPNTTGDSDHGYSTMTPHEDSEHLAFAVSEPVNLLVDNQNLSDNCSIDTSASSPHTKRNTSDDGMTTLTCGKNILAHVTVHRHMEAL